jgi:hypothetical protein
MVRAIVLATVFVSANLATPVPGREFSNAANENRVRVTRKDFGDKWPLTVDSGEIECVGGVLLVFHSGSKTYALNGAAQTRGYPKIDPIWRDNPKLPGTKVNIGPLLEIETRLLK